MNRLTPPPPPSSPHQPATTAADSAWRSFGGPLLALVGLVVAGRLAGAHWAAIAAQIAELGAWGPVAFGGAWILLGCACFPVSVLGFSAGALFGFPLGLAVVFLAANLAGLLMFGLARTFLRTRLVDFVASRPKLAAVEAGLGERALRLNALTRLSPLNYGLACYTLATGRTRLATYLAGNLATVPSMVLQVWLGAVALQPGGASDHRVALLVAALVFSGLLTWQVRRLVREALLRTAETATAKDDFSSSQNGCQ